MVGLEQMLDCGVHLGHQVRRWNPKMAPYIYGERQGVHIIDVLQTFVCLEEASNFLFKMSKQKKNILFVGTKRQFSSIIEDCANRTNSHYINQRWIGGLLTNWSTMKICVEKLRWLTEKESEGFFDRLSKKEASLLRKRKLNLEKYFNGVRNMESIPDIVVLVGQQRELNAVKECISVN